MLIWGTGTEYNKYYNCIKLLEYKEQISIVGVTSNDKDIHSSIDNYPFIKKSSILSIDFDYCIVALANMSSIVSEAEELGIEKSQLIPIRIFSIPDLNFNEYIKMKKSSLTIFSPNCWAGVCYHRLGLEFLSPTINMFEDLDDFNKLMMNLDAYMRYPVDFVETRYNPILKRDYPVGGIGDILLYFNHYENFEEAVLCWEKRKKRINQKNILVVSYACSEKTLYDFEKLPYEHKLIFTSLKIKTPSSYFLNLDNEGRLWAPVNETAHGSKNILNIVSLLNHDKEFIRVK